MPCRRGRPKLDRPKQKIAIRLDPEVLDKLREGGPGWHTRANCILRQALGLPAQSISNPRVL